MAITLDGVGVRASEVNLEVKFQDLTEEGQRRIFLENKDKFIIDALNSKYPSVRKLIWKVRNECSSDALNAVIERCICKKAPNGDIFALLDVPNLQVSDNVRELLAVSTDLQLKLWVAGDGETTLELLKTDKLFMVATLDLIQSNVSMLFDAIITNPNFEWDEEMEQKMEMFSPEGRKIIKARIETLKYTD